MEQEPRRPVARALLLVLYVAVSYPLWAAIAHLPPVTAFVLKILMLVSNTIYLVIGWREVTRWRWGRRVYSSRIGLKQDQPFQFSFNPSLKVDFRGSGVGLVASEENGESWY
jgi:hypothetical protein